MELNSHEPWVILQLDDFDEILLRIYTGDSHSRGLQSRPVIVVQLEPMAMTLHNLRPAAVSPLRPASLGKAAGVRTKPHRAPEILLLFLILHQVDQSS